MAAQHASPALYLDVETSELNRAMLRFAQVTGKRLGTVVKQNTRLIAWNLAHNAQPYGMSLAEKKMGEAAVMRDIGNVYQSAAQIYELLKQQDEKLAKAFYKLVKQGGYGQAEKILAASGRIERNATIFAPLSPEFHQRRRDGRGRVTRYRPEQIVPEGKDIKTYAKQRAAMVGFGKAGWITAGSQLGSIARVPAWITRHRGKAPGHAMDESGRKDDPFCTLTNAVRYASNILPDGEVAAALKIQREKMLTHIEHVLVSSARESGFIAHADRTATPLPMAA